MKKYDMITDYVKNESVIIEEKLGKASELVVEHVTKVTNPELLDSLRRLSFLEVVS